MRLAVIGASRGVGLACVRAARSAGHEVTALQRSAVEHAEAGVRYVVGDATREEIARAAIGGCEAVIVALGVKPGGGAAERDVCSRGTRAAIEAMRSEGVRRLVVVTSYGVGPTRSRSPFPFNVFAATILRGIMADKEAQERDVRMSSTLWTIVQPLGLTDAPATGAPLVAADGSRRSTRVPRDDVARVCVEAVESGSYVRETVAVSN
jgi:nucleoside-diphosphate-sugar epimerase